MAQRVKKPPAMYETQEAWLQSLGREDTLEEETATHSSILACRIPWTEEPGRLQAIKSQRVGLIMHALPLSLSAPLCQNLEYCQRGSGLCP